MMCGSLTTRWSCQRMLLVSFFEENANDELRAHILFRKPWENFQMIHVFVLLRPSKGSCNELKRYERTRQICCLFPPPAFRPLRIRYGVGWLICWPKVASWHLRVHVDWRRPVPRLRTIGP
jgi:hypothetical protein